jgi:hypothetical protein
MSEILPFFSGIISFLNSASVATSARGFYFGAVAKVREIRFRFWFLLVRFARHVFAAIPLFG